MANVHNLDIYPHTGDRSCLGCVKVPDEDAEGGATPTPPVPPRAPDRASGPAPTNPPLRTPHTDPAMESGPPVVYAAAWLDGWTLVWLHRRRAARTFNTGVIGRLPSTAEWMDERGRNCRLTAAGLARGDDVVAAATEGRASLYIEIHGNASRVWLRIMTAGADPTSDALESDGRTTELRLPPGDAGLAAARALLRDDRVRDYTAGRMLTPR